MARTPPRIRVAVVTGSRGEFGLLVPVIRAIRARRGLTLQLVAAGSHFLSPARTIREVEAMCPVAARVPMQRAGHRTRLDDARATARGIDGFARAFARLKPDWVVVLGDRIEAFAAASAAAIAGMGVAHIHGGDRAEGIADESMRHAITKLAHLHLAATKQSGERIVKMGERAEHVHVVGSPAIDGLRDIKPMSDTEAARLGDPQAVMLLHPCGLTQKEEGDVADAILSTLKWMFVPTLILAPNHDAGRDAIIRSIERDVGSKYVRLPRAAGQAATLPLFTTQDHLPRDRFLSLLKRMARPRRSGEVTVHGFLIGNSSAGLIEAAALGVRAVNVGPRQDGRERGDNVYDVPLRPDLKPGIWAAGPLEDVVGDAFVGRRTLGAHPFGDGKAGPRIARLLASTDPHDPRLLRKRNTY